MTSPEVGFTVGVRREVKGTSVGKFRAFVVAAAVVALTSCLPFDNLVPNARTNAGCSSATHTSPGSPCLTDNAHVSYHFQSSMTQAAQWSTLEAIFGSFDTTALNFSYHQSPPYSASPRTDIIYQMASTPLSLRGQTWCKHAAGGWKCDQQYVRYYYERGQVNRQLACHETGHAVGLLHGSMADPQVSDMHSELKCMRTGISHNMEYLGEVNATQINAQYG